MNSLTITITDLVFMSLLLFEFYSSQKENKQKVAKIYKKMIINTFIAIFIELFIHSLLTIFKVDPYSNLYIYFVKLLLLFYSRWIMLFTLYIWTASANQANYRKHFKHYIILTIVWFLVTTLSFIFIPMGIESYANLYLPVGAGVRLLYCVILTCIFVMLYILYIERKKIRDKKYIPVFIFISLNIFIMLLVKNSFFLVSSLMSFISFVIFFTLENPDIQLLEEFRRNKEYATASNNDKELFLFNVTEELRKMFLRMHNNAHKLYQLNNDSEFNKGIDYIDNSCRLLEGKINSNLGITNVEACDIKISNHVYNPKVLFEQIYRMNNNFNKKINFTIDLADDIPDLLEGDSIRIKEILNTLLENAKKYTDKGSVKLSVKCLKKSTTCRLIINVDDTGTGINLEEVEHIFSTNNTEDGIDTNNNLNSNLATAKTISILLSGVLTFSSEVEKGSSFTLIIPQIIAEKKE